MDVPFLAGLFEGLIRQHGALFARAAHGQLHRENRDAHDEQADEVDKHKKAAAIFARHIRKPPDVANADGAPGADEQKAQPGTE